MTTTLMPNDVELIHRLHRVARIVCANLEAADDFPDPDHIGRATIAVAMWSTFTGITDDARAITYARRVAAPDWPARYVEASRA